MSRTYPQEEDIRNVKEYDVMNKIRRKYHNALNLLLTPEDLPNFIVAIAWILFVINGILDDNNFIILKNHGDNNGLLHNLPWHSDNPEAVKTWIPGVIECWTIKNGQRHFMILKLKSYLNHYYCSSFRNGGCFSIVRDLNVPSGATLVARYDNLCITEIFSTTPYPTLIAYCTESLINNLNSLSNNLITFKLGSQNFLMLGPVTFTITPTTNRSVQLQLFEDPDKSYRRISYTFERKIQYFRQDVLHGFEENPVNTVTGFYSMGNLPPIVNRDDQSIFFDQLSTYNTDHFNQTNNNIKRNFGESVSTERNMGCLLVDAIDAGRIMKGDTILFKFTIRKPRDITDDCEVSPRVKEKSNSNKRKQPDTSSDYDDNDGNN